MINLFKKNPQLLSFGILQVFFTAPGQTFLIALFVTPIFDELNISLTLFATLYSSATMCAALLLNPAGRLIDKYHPKYMVVGITLSMAGGCFLLAMTSNIVMLFAAFFVIRLIGQGVFVLTGTTLLNKSFEKNRGKALSWLSLGYPLSELVYPTLALLLLSVFGWRTSYILFGVSTLVVMLPIQLLLIRHSRIQYGHFLPEESLIQPQRLAGVEPGLQPSKKLKDYTLKQVLKDPIFYPVLMSSCIPPVVMTGLFFHQNTVFQLNNWPIHATALGLGVYALSKAFASLCIGGIVDKHGPMKAFSTLVFLISIGTGLVTYGGPSQIVGVYFGCMGFALGMSAVVMNIVWTRLYGVKYIGSIKGFIGTFRNGLTGLAPLPIALALDSGLPLSSIFGSQTLIIFCIGFIPLVIGILDPRVGK